MQKYCLSGVSLNTELGSPLECGTGIMFCLLKQCQHTSSKVGYVAETVVKLGGIDNRCLLKLGRPSRN